MNVNVINDATNQPVPVKLIDNEDNTYTVELTPELAGTYTTNLTYGGLKVPFNKKTVISPTVDVSQVQVEGLEQSEFAYFWKSIAGGIHVNIKGLSGLTIIFLIMTLNEIFFSPSRVALDEPAFDSLDHIS